VKHKNTAKFIDHNLKADYQILIILCVTIPVTTCHQTVIQVSTSPNMLLHYLGKSTHEIGVKMNKKRQKPSVTLLIVT